MDLEKELFGDYINICKQIQELEYKVYTLRSSMESAHAISYDKVRSSSNPSLVSKFHYIDNLEEKIKNLENKKQNLYEDYIDKINKLTNDRYKTILRTVYLLQMDIPDAMDFMQLTPNYFYFLKRKALKELKTIINDNK